MKQINNPARKLKAKSNSLDDSLGFRLILLVNLLSRPFFAKFGQQLKLNINEWRILMTLSQHPGISATDICGISGLHKMNVSRGVSRLVKQDRVFLTFDPLDGRRRILECTAKGRAVFETIFQSAQVHESAMLAGLTRAEQETVLNLLDKLIARTRSLGDA